ncbi:MAG: YicC/YloC family endoribonuclease, partial [Planctomycetota bacterium]
MPASMTGFGDASADRDGWTVTAEIRAVNNRHLKLSVRLPDGLSGLEAEIEKRVKAVVARGSVNVSIRCDSDAASSG